ncbi:MAG: sigma-54 dependent transcriptional regulator [Verrucomicrobiota bacterium]
MAETDVSEKDPRVLVVDDDLHFLELYKRILRRQNVALDTASCGAEGLALAQAKEYAAILLDISLGDMDGFEVARQIRANPKAKHTPILFLTAHRQDQLGMEEGYAIGAVDYLFKPFNPLALQTKVDFFIELFLKSKRLEVLVKERTREIVRLKEQLEAENVYLREEIKTISHHEILGCSKAIQRVLAAVKQVAGTPTTVLVLGETGSGKELLARAIHEQSPRQPRSMVKVNCAALPTNLIESELFGREKGAFTGAHTSAAGRFELADGSSLFLDEIGELPLELQTKLLRVLQEGQFERVGSTKTLKVDVRLITATNRDLGRAVREGRFREDLYYRLNVFPITVPPLRERREDIPILVRAFVQEFATRMSKRIQTIPRKALDMLTQYNWPGNVRELRNIVERAMILSPGPALQVELPQFANYPDPVSGRLKDVERDHILAVLDKVNWRIRGSQGAAEILALKPTTLEARMKKLGLERIKR